MDETHSQAAAALQAALDSRDRGGDAAYDAQHPGERGGHYGEGWSV